MTPKDKAKELYDKFYDMGATINTKEITCIAIYHIKNSAGFDFKPFYKDCNYKEYSYKEFWQQVYLEVSNL
jgi:hypothetical protein